MEWCLARNIRLSVPRTLQDTLFFSFRKCEDLEYIPVISKGVEKSKELAAIKTSTESVLKSLKEYKATQKETLQKLDTAEMQCQKTLQDHRDKVVNRIDELAKTDTAKIKSKFQEERNAVKQGIKAVDDQIDTMETIVKGLKQSKGDNDAELFVYMKQGEITEQRSKQLLHTQQQSHKQMPKYKFQDTIQKCLDSIKALGEFEETISLNPACVNPKRLKPVSLKLRGEYKVRAANEQSKCNITGACLLPDASVMIADWPNKSLKQLDSSCKVIRSLDMGAGPYDVCFTSSNNEVAVTLPVEKKVQVVSDGASLKKIRSFPTGDECYGIACSNGQLVVCCGDPFDASSEHRVAMFSLTGTHLSTIKNDPKGQPLFSDIRRITVSSCGNKLHVTDWDKGVITTDMSGSLQHRFCDKVLEGAAGICTLDNGDLLVGGLNSNNVLHVSRDGRKLAIVLGVDRPKALVYDPSSSRLIVTTDLCDKIKVYDVK